MCQSYLSTRLLNIDTYVYNCLVCYNIIPYRLFQWWQVNLGSLSVYILVKLSDGLRFQKVEIKCEFAWEQFRLNQSKIRDKYVMGIADCLWCIEFYPSNMVTGAKVVEQIHFFVCFPQIKCRYCMIFCWTFWIMLPFNKHCKNHW